MGFPVYNIHMNKKALKAAQKTLDKEYARAVKMVVDFIVLNGKEKEKLASLKVKR
jgi:hypothetical protein